MLFDNFNNKTYIVAEVGSNHNRDFNTAVKMICEAAQAGVDAVKFQTFYPDDFVSKTIKTSEYGLDSVYKETYWLEVLENHLILPFEWYDDLVPLVREKNMDFITTVHSNRSLEFALKHNPKAIKIASMDLTNHPLLKSAAQTGLPLILATGMGTLGEIEQAVEIIEKNGCSKLVLLHCISTYPAQYNELNLNFIPVLRSLFGKEVGFSDHSIGVVSSIVAVVLGAKLIEKHFTLSRKAPGPDHHFSLEPSELTRLVEEIRRAEESLGTGRRALSAEEMKNREKYRRSVVALRDLQKGTVISTDNVALLRPGRGIPPSEFHLAVGRRLKKDVAEGQPITWDLLE